jgi:RNA polymerase sigma-70 factor (ECF subfamily)
MTSISHSPCPPATAAEPGCPSFHGIFEANARFVWRSLLGLGVGESDVPDASQQVFVVLANKLDQLEAGCSLRTFAYGICLRVASDFRKRAHLRREQLCAVVPEPATTSNQDSIVSQREALRRLRAALDQLDPGQREVFVLYEIEELAMAEVASTIGCPLQTAYSRLHAARKAVAAALGERLEDL